MFKKLTLAAAAGAGYVLGAKAGKERYAQIESKFREIAGMPAVQHATATVKETATSVAGTAKQTVNDKVETAAGGKRDQDVVVDLGHGASTGASPMAGPSSTTGTTPLGGTGSLGTAPMAGASASDSI